MRVSLLALLLGVLAAPSILTADAAAAKAAPKKTCTGGKISAAFPYQTKATCVPKCAAGTHLELTAAPASATAVPAFKCTASYIPWPYTFAYPSTGTGVTAAGIQVAKFRPGPAQTITIPGPVQIQYLGGPSSPPAGSSTSPTYIQPSPVVQPIAVGAARPKAVEAPQPQAGAQQQAAAAAHATVATVPTQTSVLPTGSNGGIVYYTSAPAPVPSPGPGPVDYSSGSTYAVSTVVPGGVYTTAAPISAGVAGYVGPSQPPPPVNAPAPVAATAAGTCTKPGYIAVAKKCVLCYDWVVVNGYLQCQLTGPAAIQYVQGPAQIQYVQVPPGSTPPQPTYNTIAVPYASGSSTSTFSTGAVPYTAVAPAGATPASP